MTRFPLLLVIAALLTAPLGAGSRARKADAPTEESGVDVAAILARFDHGKHAETFEAEGVPCLTCHTMNADLAEGLTWTDEASAAALAPGSKSCHFCHNEDNGVLIGPGRCLTCHEPGELDEDEDHGPWWIDTHATAARRDFGHCRKCHQDYSCVECHERKDPTRWRVHDGTWRSTHSIDARFDPGRCETCHLATDCIRCHSDRYGRRP